MRFQYTTLSWPSTNWMMGAGTLFQLCSLEQAYALAGGAVVALASQSIQKRVLAARFEDNRLILDWPEGSLDVPVRSLSRLTLRHKCLVLQYPGMHLRPVEHLIHWPKENELQELATEIGRQFRAARFVPPSEPGTRFRQPALPAPEPRTVSRAHPRAPQPACRQATSAGFQNQVEDFFW